jgi:demethylmenaquinone methyltransferase/2-methoxy-6-polyprenyl-1,4-benzoquinol methylase
VSVQPSGADPRRAPPEPRVRRMFDEIVPRYDLLNDILSVGMDRFWRRTVVRSLHVLPDAPVLDVGCGTGRLAERLADAAVAGRPNDGHADEREEDPRPKEGVGEGTTPNGADRRGEATSPSSASTSAVVGIDISLPMLEAGRRRLGRRVALVQGSVFHLPFPDGVFGGAASAFVLRNLHDLPGAFREIARVLEPGAGVSLVDITEPSNPLRRKLFDAYFRVAAPAAGGLAGRRRAYRYLVDSLATLPPPHEVGRLLADAGCDRVRWRSLAPGMVTLWTARRA